MMHRMLFSPRLELVFASAEMVRADRDRRDRLAELLDARISDNWPTEYWDRDAMDWTINGLESGTNRDGWGMWYWIMHGSTSNRREVVGHGGFKTPPDPQGVVEIGYAIVAERRRCGLATEACRALIEWAFSHRQVKLIAAETFPNLHASLGVMKKLGMSLIGEGSEPDSIRYGITRERYEFAPGSPVQSDPQAKPR